MAVWLGAGLVGTVAISAAIGAPLGSTTASLCALGGLGWWVVVSVVMLGGPALLVTPDGTEVDLLGWPNGLSAIRAWSCAPLILSAALPLDSRLGLALWCALGMPAGLLDLVDGYIARRFGPLTRLGMALDPLGDAVFFSMAAYGNVLVGIIPTWLAVLMVARYAGPLALTPIVLMLRRRPELTHTVWGRRNTAATGLVLFAGMIFRIVGAPVWIPAVILGIPLLGVTTLLHFVSLGRRVAEAPVVRRTLREYVAYTREELTRRRLEMARRGEDPAALHADDPMDDSGGPSTS